VKFALANSIVGINDTEQAINGLYTPLNNWWSLHAGQPRKGKFTVQEINKDNLFAVVAAGGIAVTLHLTHRLQQETLL